MRITIRSVLTAAACFAACFIINSIPAQSTYTPYAFTTLAGMPGVSGSADGTGSAARFNGPPGVAVDGAGNVYVADSTNEIIRRVTSGGVVTTLAGLAGTPGSADGTGSAARFSAPTGVAVDGAGNVYVGDAGNALIRKVTPAGVVTTLAGLAGATGGADGTGSAARFNQPAGVAVDSAGNVYVADYYNDTIRKVTPGGVVTTLAGQAGQAGSADGTGSAARFYAPFAVAADAVGNVYVADQFNQTIRQITPAGLVMTLAGQAGHPGSADGTGSAARFSAPSGVAVDAAGNVYVGDQLNETIRKITPAGAVTTLAGLVGSAGSADGIGEAARFNKPCGVAVDSAGYLYVADAWNNRITKGAPASSPPPAACAPVPAGLVGWWAGEGNANDTTGANNGLLQGGVTFVPGEAGQAFSFDGTTADVKIPASASLNVGAGNGFTIEAWISPADLTQERPIVEWNSGSAYGVHFWASVPSPNGSGPGSLSANLVDTSAAYHVISSAPGVLTPNAFQHVALTYDKASGVAVIFLNGAVIAQDGLGRLTPQTAMDLYLGVRAGPIGGGSGLRWVGQMDEVSLYDRALSVAEIQDVYSAGISGKCALAAVIAVEPQSRTVMVGATATLSVGAGGTPPLRYQWQLNGANIPGATGSSLVLTDVQFAEAGVYSVIVSNAGGAVTSSGATLTVSPQTGCAPVPAGLVGWWAGEGNANDSTGAHNGVLQGGVTFVPGEAGQAFSFDGTTADVKIPASASLNVGAGNGFTIEAWISPADLTQERPIVEWNSGSAYGVHFWASVPTPIGSGPGSLSANLVDTSGAYHAISSAPGVLTPNAFQHVALTYDKASGLAVIFLNGAAIAQDGLGSLKPQTGTDLYLGVRVGPIGGGSGLRWLGQMDEVSLYNRALSAAEIQAIYAAGSSGKCPLPPVVAAPVIVDEPQSQTVSVGGTATLSVGASGTPPLRYQWQLNGANIPGATGSSLVLTNVQLAEAGAYSVIVSNAAGAVTSSSATLTVSPQTGCAPVPAGLVGWWPGEGNANDSTGVHNGVSEGGVTFVPGEVGQAFSFNGVDADVKVAANSSLDVGLGSGLTVEAWVKPADLSQQQPMVEWNSGQGTVPYGLHFWTSVPAPHGPGPGCLFANLVDTAGGDHYFSSASGLLITSGFQHVALTYDKTSGVATIYLNGSVVAQQPLGGSFTPQTSSDLYLGYRPAGIPVGQRFVGQMDEVSLYNRALSAAEIQTIYAAGSLGKCPLPPVIAAPVIVDEPQSQTVAAGGTATFSVGANGSPPLNYQWERNGTYLSGATGSSLVLADVQLAEAGVYSVIVSNAAGAVTSSSATLTVSPQSGCAPVPAGLVGWWAGEGNANDNTGANNGVLQGSVTFVPGEVGQAFSFDGTTADVKIPANANLNVGAAVGLTIETWIKPSDLSQLRPLAEWNSGDTSIPYPYGVHFWISVPPPDGTGAGGLFGNVRDTLGASHEIASAAGLLTTAAFQHVALTYSKANGWAVIYLNGAAVAQQNLGAFTPLTTSDVYVGYRPAGLSAGHRFVGQMDEVSLYNRALSAAEIEAIYAAGSSGKCALPPVIAAPVILNEPQSQTAAAGGTATFSVGANGSPPLNYQWERNGAYLPGATGSSLVLTDVQLAEAGVYSVLVSNAAGAVTSSSATLTVSVQTANALLFAAGTDSGAQFSQVLVPIDVNLFTNILTFQFSLHWDPTVATYVDVEQFGLPGLGAGSFGTGMANSGALTVSWDDPTGSGQSLGDGTAVFAIRFALIGNEGAASAVTMDGTPTALQAAKSDLTLVPVQTSPGRLSVALAPKVVIGGHVMYYPTNYPPSGPSAQAVAGVTVNLTGATNLNQATATDGSYSFPGLAPGLAYEVSPAKPDDEPPANGVTTLGIALIRRQILDLAPLASPYAVLAADVNASGTVDTLDIALIRRLILALTNTFPAGLWRFVPADYVFPDPSSPWAAPSIRWYTNPLADLAGQDYVAIKLGDVNHSWVSPGPGPQVRLPGGTQPGLKASPELSAVRFEARGQVVQRGQRVAVRVSVGGFTGGTSAQFSLGWDAKLLRYVGVGEFGVRGLGEDNFGAALAGSGRLTFSWDDPAGTGLEAADGGPLFTVYFDVIGARGSVSPVAFEDWPTVREATVDLVSRALASWDGQVIVAGKRPGLVYGGDAVQGTFRISVPSVIGRQYILEFTDSLSGGHWRGLDAVVGDGSVKTLADPTATTQPRLYRLRVE